MQDTIGSELTRRRFTKARLLLWVKVMNTRQHFYIVINNRDLNKSIDESISFIIILSFILISHTKHLHLNLK